MALKSTLLLSALAVALGENVIVLSDTNADKEEAYKSTVGFRFCTKNTVETTKDEEPAVCLDEDELDVCVTVPKGSEKLGGIYTLLEEVPEKCAEAGEFAVLKVSKDSVESVTSFKCVKDQAPTDKSVTKKEACDKENDEQAHWLADIPSVVRDFTVCSKKDNECPKEEDKKDQCTEYKEGDVKVDDFNLVNTVPEGCDTGFAHLELGEKDAIKALHFYDCKEDKPALSSTIKKEECDAEKKEQQKWIDSSAASASVAAAILATYVGATIF